LRFRETERRTRDIVGKSVELHGGMIDCERTPGMMTERLICIVLHHTDQRERHDDNPGD
jgi:hypothetical protein